MACVVNAILQTKVGPSADVAAFRKSIATSIQLLAPEPDDYIDLVALHGINRTKELDWIFAPGGCYSVLEVCSAARLDAPCVRNIVGTAADGVLLAGMAGKGQDPILWLLVSAENDALGHLAAR